MAQIATRKAASGSGKTYKANTPPKKKKKKNTGLAHVKASTKPKTTNPAKKKKRRKRSNPGGLNFRGFSNTLKSTIAGTAGAFGTRVGADISLSMAQGIAPNFGLLRNRLARPVVSLGLALWLMPKLADMLGASNETQSTVRVGGLIATGLDGLEILIPDAQGAITSRFNAFRNRLATAGTDTRQIETNNRTALSGTVADQVASAAAQGAADRVSSTLAGLGYGQTDTGAADDESSDSDWD